MNYDNNEITKDDLLGAWKEISEGKPRIRYIWISGRFIDLENMTPEDKEILNESLGETP